MVGVGAMVGAGIFVLAGVAIEQAGPGAIIAFVLCGVITTITAFSWAELAAAFPEAGEDIRKLGENQFHSFPHGLHIGSLTRMFQGPYSIASTLVSASTPLLAAQ